VARDVRVYSCRLWQIKISCKVRYGKNLIGSITYVLLICQSFRDFLAHPLCRRHPVGEAHWWDVLY